jgi:hypothetical protein
MDQFASLSRLTPAARSTICDFGVAIDTVAFGALNPGAAPAVDNAVVAPGDSKTVRNFAVTSRARLDFVCRQGATAGFVGIKSPRFHDVSRGLQWILSETPSTRLMPPETGQPVYGADVMQLTVSGGGAEVDGGALGIYYQDLPGSAALLKNPGDILPNVVNIKPTEVDCAVSAVANAWVDTAVNVTENLLKANTWYAVLGYETDTACGAAGVKGPETGNLRVCGPGAISGTILGDYFVWMSERHQAPYIPVFNANNRGNFFACINTIAVAGTIKLTLNLAELAASFTP